MEFKENKNPRKPTITCKVAPNIHHNTQIQGMVNCQFYNKCNWKVLAKVKLYLQRREVMCSIHLTLQIKQFQFFEIIAIKKLSIK
jgi:hypothetical protein